ncbi:phage holin family protein [Lacrimispora sp. 210928-DFI.3.58]|uniref:phage holin family protein n=1 Tax=Lacrimispora sp. 210928-DFI.3.58 TaxID=2883214 RepID=UPI001D09916E|nr:phage holin family protein [Lacrimispora sp. 210928-DFI.3.58]MCB7317524.1 phage holin family protein [Lacrimispora sp. 210928-DFI.3.58]
MKKEYAYLLQGAVAAVTAWLSDRLGILFPVLCVLLGMMAIDYVTGMLASKAEALDHPGDSNYGWSSKKGAKGIIKKVGYMCVIAAAMVLDYVIFAVSGKLGVSVPTSAFFGLLVAVWYLLNELLSIIENAGRMGADVPEWLIQYIAVLKDKIDKGDYENGDKPAEEGGDPAISRPQGQGGRND